MNMKLKWGTAGRLRRSAVVLGAVGLAASAGLLASAGSAMAAVGTDPGGMQLLQTGVVVTTGPLTTTTTWSSQQACPSGFQTSAEITEYTTAGTLISSISPVTGTGLSAAGFSGTLLGTPGALLSSAGISATSPGTVEWVIGCYAGASATGAVSFIGDTFVSVASGATVFTTSPTGPVVANTATTVGATPNPVAVGATATLTANVTSGSAFPPGTVQFENCPTSTTCTNINTPVAVNTGSVSVPATTSTSFATAGSVNIVAAFTPTDANAFKPSTSSAFSLAVGSTLAGGTNPVSINVTVPSTGTLSVTVAAGSVTLAAASPATTPDETATGTFNNVTVTDSRNTFPGWSVSGQESAFTQTPAANTIPANSLGWTPAAVGTLGTGVLLGGVVAPVGANTGSSGPGLGTAAVLVQAHAPNGFGTNTVNAGLLLDIPSSTPPGAYAGTLTITYVSAN